MTSPINFPQVPFVDSTGNVDIQWKLWLMNPQFATVNLSTTLAVGSGGTGLVSGTPGGVLGFIGPTVIACSPRLGQWQLVLGGGSSSTLSTPVGLGTTTTVLHGNAVGPPSFEPVNIATDVSGLGAGVADFLATPDSSTLNTALTDHSVIVSGTIRSTTANSLKSSDDSAGISTTVTTSSLVGKTLTFKDGLLTGFA